MCPGAGVSVMCHVVPKTRLFSSVEFPTPSRFLSIFMIAEGFEKQKKKSNEMDSYFKIFNEKIKISNQCVDELLQLEMQKSRPVKAGTRERKVGELDNIVTEIW